MHVIVLESMSSVSLYIISMHRPYPLLFLSTSSWTIYTIQVGYRITYFCKIEDICISSDNEVRMDDDDILVNEFVSMRGNGFYKFLYYQGENE